MNVTYLTIASAITTLSRMIFQLTTTTSLTTTTAATTTGSSGVGWHMLD